MSLILLVVFSEMLSGEVEVMHNNHHYNSVLMHPEQTSYSETFSVSSFLNPRSYFNLSGSTLFYIVQYEVGKRQNRTNIKDAV